MLEAMNRSALREIVAGHREQIGLCKMLELIADALPSNIDPDLCKAAAGSIHRVMTKVVQVERTAFADEGLDPVRIGGRHRRVGGMDGNECNEGKEEAGQQAEEPARNPGKGTVT